MTEMKELKRQSSENNAKLNKIIRILKKENESAVNDDNKVNILDTTITPVLFPLNDRESIERFDLDLCGNNDFKDKMVSTKYFINCSESENKPRFLLLDKSFIKNRWC